MTLPTIITLIGYRGTGKSTVAKLLAERIGFDWVDVDDQIELLTGKLIANIFAEEGESAFRDVEAEVVADLTQREKLVIAAGGGSILRAASRQRMVDAGYVVWLTATPTTIEARLNHDPTTGDRRPRLTSRTAMDEIEHVLAERIPLYESIADVCLTTDDKSPTAIVAELVPRLLQ